jgi:S-adenosylmethionine:tRNA ribosyltransferase-isomerase
MKLSDYQYDLPPGLVAQRPCAQRQRSGLLLLDKKTGDISHDIFENITEYIDSGDCLVLNDTKVIPARLNGKRKYTSGQAEFVLLKNHGDDIWEVMVRPGRRAGVGSEYVFGCQNELEAVVVGIIEDGNRLVKFKYTGIFMELLDRIGMIPLPPYIEEKDQDLERYQTVYARYEGSAAAPTAGLHFTEKLLGQITSKGAKLAFVTLHIGIGTFRPVRVKNIEEHKMHSEFFSLTQENCDIINEAANTGKRIIAVGTTSCRALESAADSNGCVHPYEGDTDIFIYPGYKFKIVKEMITNFHLPGSTLIMLVSALASREHILNAYKAAVDKNYRFFSFGDAMFIYDGDKKNGCSGKI